MNVFVALSFGLLMLCAPPPLQPQLSSPPNIADLRLKADAGDTEAARTLAEAYDQGNGVAQSDQSAAEWYRKAALQGDGVAAANLGVMYWMGRGVERNREEAVQWYHRAAKSKNAMALFNLGAASYDGTGAPEDPIHAFAWFSLAADVGSPQGIDAVQRMNVELKNDQKNEAWSFIGEMYENGYTLPRDANEAARWYEKAASNGDPSAGMHLASLIVSKRLGPPNYSRALYWCQMAAQKNYGPAL